MKEGKKKRALGKKKLERKRKTTEASDEKEKTKQDETRRFMLCLDYPYDNCQACEKI
jgi:hypothetical protein